MKLAISNIAWLPEENVEVLAVLKRLSITGIEVAPTALFENPTLQRDGAVKETRRFWNDNGIEIVAMQSLLFERPELNLFGEKKVREEMFEYLKKIIDLGGKLGAKSLVFGSPKNRLAGGLSKDVAFKIAANFFSELAGTAADCGTCLCVEPNAPDYGCDFITNVAQAIELVESVSHSGFGLHVDAGVMTLNDEPHESTLEAAFRHMHHFHISEPFLMKVTDAKTNHDSLGMHLRKTNYEGWVSIEMRSGLGDSNARVVDECLRFAYDKYIKVGNHVS